MTLLAALSTGVAAYLAVGYVLGSAPARRLRRPRGGEASRGQLWLTQAGVRLTPRQFWLASSAVGAVAFVLLSLATATPAVALVPSVGAALAPRAYFARQRARRLREVTEAWPDGLREIKAAVTAGMSLPQALSALAHSGPPALQRAFGRFPPLVRVLGVTPALELIKAELADPTSDRVLEVLILAHERGGPVVGDLLSDLAEATTDDLKIAEEIATAGLEHKLNARAVFVLPWLVLASLTAAPGHFRVFYQSPTGFLVVVVGAVLSLLGVAMTSRLGRGPAEERVLTEAAGRG